MPAISVIVPVYNDRAGLEATLRSLLNQSMGDFEVVVADNGSTDDTGNAARDWAARFDGVIKVVVEHRRTSYAARNTGIRAATGQIICFIDADMSAPPDYLAAVERLFRSPEVMLCAAPVEVTLESRTRPGIYNMLTGFPIRQYFESTGFIPTNCLSIRRTVLDAIGVFDERLESGGDREFTERAVSAGFKPSLLESVTLIHPARATLASLTKKSRRGGRGIAQLLEYYPERYASRRRKWLSWKGFLPLRPKTLALRAKSRGVEITMFDLLIMIWYRPVLRWHKLRGYAEERRNLRNRGGQRPPTSE